MRKLLLSLVAVMAMGCSAAGASPQGPTTGPNTDAPTAGPNTDAPTADATAEEPTAPAVPSPSGGAPISLTGDPVTGASDSFTLAFASFDVAWTTTADTAGCYFDLVLRAKVDGPSIHGDVKLLPEAKSYSGTFLWVFIAAGTYVLQEDKTGVVACKGPWSATITRR